MLGGQDFGGRHEGGLVAVLHGDEHGLQRDDGLAGADIALEEAAHGVGLLHVGDDFAQGAFLRGGGVEGEDLADGFADLVAGLEGDAGALAEAAAFELEAEFEEEELFEDEAAVGGGGPVLELGHGCAFGREVHFGRARIRDRADRGAKHGGGQALGDGAAHAFEEVEDDLALPAGSESGAAERLVDGGDAADFEQACFGVVARVGQDLKLRLDHFEVAGGAGGLDLAEDGDGLAGVGICRRGRSRGTRGT